MLSHHCKPTAADDGQHGQGKDSVNHPVSTLVNHGLRTRCIFGIIVVPVGNAVAVGVNRFVGIKLEGVFCIIYPIAIRITLCQSTPFLVHDLAFKGVDAGVDMILDAVCIGVPLPVGTTVQIHRLTRGRVGAQVLRVGDVIVVLVLLRRRATDLVSLFGDGRDATQIFAVWNAVGVVVKLIVSTACNVHCGFIVRPRAHIELIVDQVAIGVPLRRSTAQGIGFLGC